MSRERRRRLTSAFIRGAAAGGVVAIVGVILPALTLWVRALALVEPIVVWSTFLALDIAVILFFYVRVYRNPVIRRTSEEPSAVTTMKLSALPEVDRALKRARQRKSTLMMAGVPEERWEQALAAAESPERAIDAFARSIGATVGAPAPDLPDQTLAYQVTLPALRLRFAQKSAIAAARGRVLEHGRAVALARAIHRGGAGPRQAIVLDHTTEQNARQVLAEVAQVSFVVLDTDELRDLLLSDRPGRALEAALVRQLRVADLSPYQTAGGVVQESLFFGRERELRTMADRTLRSFLLVGSRQMGKSTLLRALERRLSARDDVEVHYLTLADGDLGYHLAHHLDAGAAQRDLSVDRVRALAAGSASRPRLWLVDEADRFVVHDAGSDFALTRMMRQLTQDGLAYFVLTGFWELYAATVLDAQHPLLNFAEIIRLEPLDGDAARQLATAPMASLGLSWDAGDTVEWLIRGTGRRANLIVLACKAMIETLPADTRTLTRAHLERVVHSDRDLADQLRALHRHGPLDRAIVYQALALHDSGRAADPATVRAELERAGLTASMAAFEQACDRLELGYVLIERDGELACPVPLMRDRIAGQAADLGAQVRDSIADWRRQSA